MQWRTPVWGTTAVCVCAIALARPASAATIAVPAGGDLQAALNAAAPGDVITLAPGAIYAGNFVLPNKGAIDTYITVRSAAPDSQLPPPGVRITPAYAALLPKIKSPNNVSALRTAAAANHWRLLFLEFQANMNGYGEIIALGAGDSSQTQVSQVPYALVVDRVYVHGDPVMGQKRGIALHSSDTAIVNSYIAECKTVGQDTQAISGFNGPGNYLIENNYLEGAGENVLFGGSDPQIPNLVTSNITFRHNYLSKPRAWRNPILASPASVTASVAVGNGALGAGTYGYKIVARGAAGQANIASSVASAEVSATIAAGVSGGVTITWTPVVGASEYWVYGRTPGAVSMYWKTTDPFFTDTGASGTNGAPGSGTKWSVKNVFELKNAQDVLIEGNVFENLWVADQSGFPIVFTPRNQGGTAPWTVVQRVTFRYNLVRHTAGGVNILGTDNLKPSQRTNHIAIEHNVFDDLGSAWGSGSKPFQIGDGPDAITIDHNIVVTTGSTILWLYGGTPAAPKTITNCAYTNNMSPHNTYGIVGNATPPGVATTSTYMPGGIVTGNVLAGGNGSVYPPGNFFPTVADWQASFVDFVGRDYRQIPTSPYLALGADVETVMSHANAALSGDLTTPPGNGQVQITTTSLPNGLLNQAYAQALACTGGQAPCAWQLVDASLPTGLVFDAGAAVVAGTPTAVQTGAVTVTAYDPTWPANNATATLTVTIDPPPFVVTIPSAPAGEVGVSYTLQPSVSGVLGTASWTVLSGSLPPGVNLDAFTGAMSGVPSGWGTFTAVVQAQDSWQPGRVDSKPVTITVAPSALVVSTTDLAPAIAQQPYVFALQTTGGSGSVTWTLIGGALPTGVALDATGTIAGTPVTAGTFPIAVQATDANWPGHTAAASFALTVTPPPFVVSVPAAPAGTVGAPYLLAATATGQLGSVTWSLASGAFPAGVAINSATGVISGIPAAAGTFTAVVRASDAWDGARIATAPVTIVVAAAPLTITTTTLPDATVRRAYQATLAISGGTGAIAWTIASGSLPAALTLASNGVISGTPTSVATSSFTVRAVDAAGTTATKALTLKVGAREIVLYTVDITAGAGNWVIAADATAAAALRLVNPDLQVPKITIPLAAPTTWIEIPFQAEAGVGYHLWVRGKAAGNLWSNDSIYVQFSGSVTSSGTPTFRIGTTSAATVSIEDGTNAGLSGWGWADDSYGGFGSTIYFAASGAQRIRIQQREDGVSLDQIVLSANTYATRAPGATKNDTTIVPR